MPTLPVAEVVSGLRSDGLRVFDCNPPEAWVRGHVPGAVNLDPMGFSPNDLPAATGAMLVFYAADESSAAAAFAARRAHALGHSNVWVMSAGLAGWENEGCPVARVRPKRSAIR